VAEPGNRGGRTLKEQFAVILRRHLKYLKPGQELTPEATLLDLGLDSLAAVSLILDLEDEFNITLPDSSIVAGSFRDSKTLWEVVEAATALPSPAD
jgi:acyl carrier protein